MNIFHKNYHLLARCLIISLIVAGPAAAQTTLRIGPQVGLNRTSASLTSTDLAYQVDRPFAHTYRFGFEAGMLASLGFGRLSVQPALLFSQKGFNIQDEYTAATLPNGVTPFFRTDATYRLNYLTMPINVVYALQDDGQGFHLFAGPYLGLLLGGDFTTTILLRIPHSGMYSEGTFSGPISPGSKEEVFSSTKQVDYNTYYSRRLDAGGQLGIGYLTDGLLFQLAYSQGLRDVGVNRAFDSNGSTVVFERNTSYNCAFQATLSYLFALKK